MREYPLLQPAPGWQVQDPATIIAAVLGALAEVVTEARGAQVVCISVSTAMHGLIGLDTELTSPHPTADLGRLARHRRGTPSA